MTTTVAPQQIMDIIDVQNTSMTFTENQQGNAILDRLRSQKELGRFCDVVVQVNDKMYSAHRNVLAACSPYFDSMLKVNTVAKERLTVTCNEGHVFEVILDYMYTGKVVIDGSTVAELLRLGNLFIINKLKAYCCEYLERTLNVTNCFTIRDLSTKCGCPDLAQTVEEFILQNISDIITQDEIVAFQPSVLELLLNNKKLSFTEDQKLWISVRWTKYNVKVREQNFRTLLSTISWSDISESTVYKAIKCDDLFSTSKICLFQILHALDQCGKLLSAFTELYHELKDDVTQMQHLEQQALIQLAVDAAVGDLDQAPPSLGPFLSVDRNMGNTSNTSELSDVTTNSPAVVNNQSGSSSDILARSQVLITDKTNFEEFSTIGNLPYSLSGLDSSSELDRSKDTHNSSSDDIGMTQLKVKHKRKGFPKKVPVVRISRSKIKMEKETKKSKQPGRPPKKLFSDQLRKQELKEELKFKQEKKPEDIDTEEYDSEDKELLLASDTNSDSDSGEQNDPERKKPQPKVKVKCTKCFYVASGDRRLELHMKSAHRDETTYACSLCDYSCQWNREYYRHMKSHFDGPPFHCDYDGCDYIAERIQPLLYHRMVHTDERPFQCTVCNMKFRTKNNLGTHLRCHTGEKPFRCETCSRSFATKGTLEQHSVTHSNHRPYLCDTCGFSTKYQSHLIAHKRIHTGDVFRCQYPGCNYSTPKRSQLGAHMRIHMCIRSHICKVCGRGFVEKSHLVRHNRIHLEDKPFKCQYCDYGSTRRDKLKEHEGKHHGNNASAKMPYKPRRPRRQAFDPQLFPGVTQGLVPPPTISNESKKLSEVVTDYSDNTQIGITAADTLTIQMQGNTTTFDTRTFGLMLPTVVSVNNDSCVSVPSIDSRVSSPSIDSHVSVMDSQDTSPVLDPVNSQTLDTPVQTTSFDAHMQTISGMAMRVSTPSLDERVSGTGMDGHEMDMRLPGMDSRADEMADVVVTDSLQQQHVQLLDAHQLLHSSHPQLSLTHQHSVTATTSHLLPHQLIIQQQLQQQQPQPQQHQQQQQQHPDLAGLSALIGIL